MNIKKLLFLILLSFYSYEAVCQDWGGDWSNTNEKVFGKLVTGVKRDNTLIRGLFYGMIGDSIFLQMQNKIVSFKFDEFNSILIDKKKSSTGFAIGLTSGMYLGSIIFLSSDNGGRYMDYDGLIILAAAEIAFALLGGGIGYIIDRNSDNELETFYFNGDEASVTKEKKRFLNFISKDEGRKIHLSFYLSQVSTRYSELIDGSNYFYYGYSNIKSFNLLRRISLTYEIFSGVQTGISLNLLGEPNISLSGYTSGNSIHLNETYDGKGYYIVFNVLPLRDITADNFQIILGGGVGAASLTYRSELSVVGPSSTEKLVSNNKSYFSSFFAAEVRINLVKEISISAQFDYFYLPGRRLAVPEFKIEERPFSNSGYGIGLSYNF